MKKTISKSLILLALVVAPLFAAAPAFAVSGGESVFASRTTNQMMSGVNQTGGNDTSTNALPILINRVVDVLLFIIGAVAVIMIIVGGIRYVTSNGDQSQLKAAKDTILFSVIGLIIAIMAYAIVKWIINVFA